MVKCEHTHYFGWPPDIFKEKLFRYAKYGRPGVKTEYNESYRDWKNAQSKWDFVAVSVYSQEELKKRSKAEKTPPVGWPCRQFNVTIGEDDNTILEPMDPYSDEWFDNFDLATTLKVKAAELHKKGDPRKNCPKSQTSKLSIRSTPSRASNNAKFQKKMVDVNAKIISAANRACDCHKQSKPCAKRKKAWVSCEHDDCPEFPAKNKPKHSNVSNQASRQASEIRSEIPISREISRAAIDKPISRNISAAIIDKPIARKSNQGKKTSENPLLRQRPKSAANYGKNDRGNGIKAAELYSALDNLKHNITQHKSLDGAQPVQTKQKNIGPVPSESVLSFSSSDTPRPGSARTTTYKQIPVNAVSKKTADVKKAVFSGKPEDNSNAVYRNLTDTDMKMMRNMYDKLAEPQDKKYINKSYSQAEEDRRIFDEAKRTTQNAYSRGATQNWKTNHTDDFAYYDSHFDEVQKKRNPYYQMDNDIFNMKTRSNFKKPQTQYYDQYEDKTEHPMLPHDNKFGKGDKQDEKTYSGRSATEREKIIADGNKLLERQSKNQSTVDSRWKSYDAYQNWNPAEREIPVWAEKTFKSLGSGFWNLPFNKDDDWKKREQLSEIERNRLRMEFKKCTQDKTTEEKDPFLANYYPDIRTNPAFMSQYLRDYYRRRVPGEEDVD